MEFKPINKEDNKQSINIMLWQTIKNHLIEIFFVVGFASFGAVMGAIAYYQQWLG